MKAEDLINKHLTLEEGSDFAITDGRIYKAIINALNEAINYTHCCTELLCLDKHIATYLTEGRKYKLLFEDEDEYYLKNDDNEVFGYSKIYFEVVKTQ